jgi:hypothetical protein
MSQASLLKAALDPLLDRPDELVEIILRQAGVIEQLQEELADLKQQIKDINDRNDGLSAKVEALEKKAVRQAAPFRIDEKDRVVDRVVERENPGRAQGHAGVCRAVPAHVDEGIGCRWCSARTVAGPCAHGAVWSPPVRNKPNRSFNSSAKPPCCRLRAKHLR